MKYREIKWRDTIPSVIRTASLFKTDAITYKGNHQEDEYSTNSTVTAVCAGTFKGTQDVYYKRTHLISDFLSSNSKKPKDEADLLEDFHTWSSFCSKFGVKFEVSKNGDRIYCGSHPSSTFGYYKLILTNSLIRMFVSIKGYVVCRKAIEIFNNSNLDEAQSLILAHFECPKSFNLYYQPFFSLVNNDEFPTMSIMDLFLNPIKAEESKTIQLLRDNFKSTKITILNRLIERNRYTIPFDVRYFKADISPIFYRMMKNHELREILSVQSNDSRNIRRGGAISGGAYMSSFISMVKPEFSNYKEYVKHLEDLNNALNLVIFDSETVFKIKSCYNAGLYNEIAEIFETKAVPARVIIYR